jgi:hypothetical protein
VKSDPHVVETEGRDPGLAAQQPQTTIVNTPTVGSAEAETITSAEQIDDSARAQIAQPSGKRRRWMRRETWQLGNLLLGVLAFIVLIFQLKIMDKQTDLMNTQTQVMQQGLTVSEHSLHAFRVSERAYVGVESLTANLKAGEIVIMLHNIGSVPAQAITVDVQEIRVTASTNIETTDPGERVNESLGSKFRWEAGEVQLYPGTPMPVVVSLEKFTEDEMIAIRERKETLYVGGTIQYEDGFGKSERTVFAFRYNAPNDRWVVHSDLSRFFKQQDR